MDFKLLNELHQSLNNRVSVVLIRIIRRSGSAPRGVGSACMIDAEGNFFGTIGGGLLEYRAIQAATELLESGTTLVTTVELTAQEIEREGMICGGRIELYLEPFVPDSETLELFSVIVDLVKGGKSGTLVTRIRNGVQASSCENRILFVEGECAFGILPAPPIPIQSVGAQLIERNDREPPLFVEPIQQEPELLLFGAGHIGTFVSSIAKMVGFRVSIFDDRSEFANQERFPEADAIYAMPYTEAFQRICLTDTSYIVIVTRGHAGDRNVLELVLNADITPAYVGMIGSLKKRDALYRVMIEKGTAETILAEIHSPIGLKIGAKTPEEIAVSIIAEIIQVKAGGVALGGGSHSRKTTDITFPSLLSN